MAKFVLNQADVDSIVDTIVSLKRNSLPTGYCPYAVFGNGMKCSKEGCSVHQRKFWENYEKKWQDFFVEHKDKGDNKRIYVMSTDMFEEKHIKDMSEAEIKELCKQDESGDMHDVYDSMEELSANWNSGEIFYPSNSFMRVFND